MIVNEIFYSIQGEGFLAGTPSTFIRLAGCPLRCKWCDTKYAWPPDAGTDLTADAIVQKVLTYPARHVVVTGGEPMINPALSELTDALKAAGHHITIETSAIAFIPNLKCDLMSISPKLTNSMQAQGDLPIDIPTIKQLIAAYNYQFKFVVANESDVHEALALIAHLEPIDRSRLMLMPQAASRDELLATAPTVARLCIDHCLAYSQRLHILLWDKNRGV